MQSAAVIAGAEREAYSATPSESISVASKFAGLPQHDLSGMTVIAGALPGSSQWMGVPDDNRTAIFPDITFDVDGRLYALAAKGVGARTPLYGGFLQDWASTLGARRDNSFNSEAVSIPRYLTSEIWLGEAPWGAQSESSAKDALEITDLVTDGCAINGFYICPVIEVEEYPSTVLQDLHVEDTFWFRKYHGKQVQEQRLMPSNIRLFHQSEYTLGATLAGVLRLFHIESIEDLDDFINHFIASGMAALTVFARTARASPWGIQGLELRDVWLDKDCVVASDGTLHFCDLEGLEWIVAGQDVSLEQRVQRQFGRSFYEFMYGLDILLRERERLAEKTPSQAERRQDAATRIDLALAPDSFLHCEINSSCVDVVVECAIAGAEQVPLHVIDL
ncbi:MAG TPA: hypothetical protein VKK79_16995 [Candidatus Lokiarchaeia archaeon]|nr:hypothetical protein [Candidatus Lokiarchaeia archaeon]